MCKSRTPQDVITATQLLLYTLNEVQKPLSMQQLMGSLVHVAEGLRKTGLVVDVFLRAPSSANIWSEQLEEALWYWLSNGFVQVEDTPARGLSLTDSGQKLLSEKDLAAAINRDLDDETLAKLAEIVREAVSY